MFGKYSFWKSQSLGNPEFRQSLEMLVNISQITDARSRPIKNMKWTFGKSLKQKQNHKIKTRNRKPRDRGNQEPRNRETKKPGNKETKNQQTSTEPPVSKKKPYILGTPQSGWRMDGANFLWDQSTIKVNASVSSQNCNKNQHLLGSVN